MDVTDLKWKKSGTQVLMLYLYLTFDLMNLSNSRHHCIIFPLPTPLENNTWHSILMIVSFWDFYNLNVTHYSLRKKEKENTVEHPQMVTSTKDDLGRMKDCQNDCGLPPNWLSCPYMVKTSKTLLCQNHECFGTESLQQHQGMWNLPSLLKLCPRYILAINSFVCDKWYYI